MNGIELQVGQRVTFIYHEKQRTGTVDKTKPTYFVLKLDTREDDTDYKGFAYVKVSSMTVVT